MAARWRPGGGRERGPCGADTASAPVACGGRATTPQLIVSLLASGNGGLFPRGTRKSGRRHGRCRRQGQVATWAAAAIGG